MRLEDWIDSYRVAWETADLDLVTSLFAEGASYRAAPTRDPYVGHDAIRAYWQWGAGSQSETKVRMGRPYVDGDRVAVEWWTTLVSEGERSTLCGCLLLRFAPDGRCADLREYWHELPDWLEPHPGWGE